MAIFDCKIEQDNWGNLFIILKGIAVVYYFGVNFAVNKALWLLKPGTRDPKLQPFNGCSSWYFWIPDQNTKNNKDKLPSTI